MLATKSRKKRLSLSDRLREAVRESGLTQKAISEAAGIHQSQTSRFMSGLSLSAESMERLLDYFDFSIERNA